MKRKKNWIGTERSNGDHWQTWSCNFIQTPKYDRSTMNVNKIKWSANDWITINWNLIKYFDGIQVNVERGGITDHPKTLAQSFMSLKIERHTVFGLVLNQSIEQHAVCQNTDLILFDRSPNNSFVFASITIAIDYRSGQCICVRPHITWNCSFAPLPWLCCAAYTNQPHM